MKEEDAGGSAISHSQRQFGRQAALYATSRNHATGSNLELLATWAAPRPSDLVLDIATGTGFTAFALAPAVKLVVATDITAEMLSEARRLAAQRRLQNVLFAMSAAEVMSFPDRSFDIVTCRVAAHHFADVARFVAEAYRVSKVGGRVLFVDTVAPEDAALADFMNELELRRDPSHVRNYAPSEWRGLFEQRGFAVQRMVVGKTELEFQDWTRRAGTPAHEIAALRRLLESASPSEAAAFEIRRANQEIRFAWDTVVLEAWKSATS